MGNRKFKVGDRVRIKSLDWYNENKNKIGFICFDRANFIPEMSRYCGEILTINRVVEEFEQYLVSECAFSWTDEMIEGLAEEETVHNKWTGLKVELELSKTVIGISNVESLHGERFMSGFVKAIIPPDGYIFKDENGNEILTSKIILEKKKKEYPKTYKECCEVLGLNDLINMHLGFMDEDTKIIASTNYHIKTLILLNCLTKLRICRDAYWKIAGDEMGLEKPWKLSIGTPIYYIYYNRTVSTIKNDYADDIQGNVILAFPTEEMRDAFYENFKELIESVKELL